MLDPARLVFIDETAVSTNMVRLRGRAPRGVRVIGAVPLGRWETITFVAALRHNKMVAPMVVEGAMTGEMFLAYVENCLVPTLRRNDIVVMDNCRVHLGTGIGRAIETVGATLRYLPKYSPDLASGINRKLYIAPRQPIPKLLYSRGSAVTKAGE